PRLATAGLLDRVVPSPSATIRGIPLTTIQGDHSQIIQPTSATDTRYRVWRDAFDEFALANPSNLGQTVRGEDLTDTNTSAPALSPGEEPEYASVFISYSADDEDFAQRLHTDLQKHGVNCWFAPHDMRIGDKKRTRVDEFILAQKKLLLILSQSSVKSTWVEKEVETAFDKEEENHSLVLFLIMLDRVILQEKAGWAADIRRQRHIGDFTRWPENAAYQQALERLLRDLKAEQS
ncbi:MAG: toll/interleukin-1 receptor domain-containing protein, partial [Ktedonobacteraceae bacterium]